MPPRPKDRYCHFLLVHTLGIRIGQYWRTQWSRWEGDSTALLLCAKNSVGDIFQGNVKGGWIMSKRKFLMPLVTLAAAFATDHANANVIPELGHSPSDTASIKGEAGKAERATMADEADQAKRMVATDGQDQFSFILRRDEGGQLTAMHESHYSHYSHESHGSHRSHYSSY